MQAAESDKIIALRNLVEDITHSLPNEEELHEHLQRANGDVNGAVNSVVDDWELADEERDFQAQQHHQQSSHDFRSSPMNSALPYSHSAELLFNHDASSSSAPTFIPAGGTELKLSDGTSDPHALFGKFKSPNMCLDFFI